MVIEVAVGYVIAWVVGKARRVAQRADGVVDQALDAGVDRVAQLVRGKLAADSAMQRLQVEAAESGEVSERTRQRVALALADAVDQDGSFAEELRAAVADAQRAAGPAVAAHGGVAVTGGVSATATIVHRTSRADTVAALPPYVLSFSSSSPPSSGTGGAF